MASLSSVPATAVTVICRLVWSPAVSRRAVALPFASVVPLTGMMRPELAAKVTLTLGIALLLTSRARAVSVICSEPSESNCGLLTNNSSVRCHRRGLDRDVRGPGDVSTASGGGGADRVSAKTRASPVGHTDLSISVADAAAWRQRRPLLLT